MLIKFVKDDSTLLDELVKLLQVIWRATVMGATTNKVLLLS